MIKSLLIPLFSFSVLKLSLTLVITYSSLSIFAIGLFLLIIVANLYILTQLIRDRSIFPDSIKCKFSKESSSSKNNENKAPQRNIEKCGSTRS